MQFKMLGLTGKGKPEPQYPVPKPAVKIPPTAKRMASDKKPSQPRKVEKHETPSARGVQNSHRYMHNMLESDNDHTKATSKLNHFQESEEEEDEVPYYSNTQPQLSRPVQSSFNLMQSQGTVKQVTHFKETESSIPNNNTTGLGRFSKVHHDFSIDHDSAQSSSD